MIVAAYSAMFVGKSVVWSNSDNIFINSISGRNLGSEDSD